MNGYKLCRILFEVVVKKIDNDDLLYEMMVEELTDEDFRDLLNNPMDLVDAMRLQGFRDENIELKYSSVITRMIECSQRRGEYAPWGKDKYNLILNWKGEVITSLPKSIKRWTS